MRKHIGAKVISLIVVLLMVFGISSYISTMSLKHSQDTISEIADLYMGIENKNAELLEIDTEDIKEAISRFEQGE